MVLPPLRRVCRPAEKGGEVETAAFRLANKMPPPLHACPLPRAGLGRGTRSPSGAPPLHAGPLHRAGLGRGTRSPSGAPPTAPRLPSAPRGPWARDPVPLRRPPLHACPLPRAGLGRGTRSPSGAPPPRLPSAPLPSPLRGPAPPGRNFCCN